MERRPPTRYGEVDFPNSPGRRPALQNFGNLVTRRSGKGSVGLHMKNPLRLLFRRWEKSFFAAVFLVMVISPRPVFAAIIGTNPPVPPLTLERIDSLPADARKV